MENRIIELWLAKDLEATELYAVEKEDLYYSGVRKDIIKISEVIE